MKRLFLGCALAAAILVTASTSGAAPTPTATIHPSHLRAIQHVAVVGTGFTPHSTISVTECRAAFTDPGPIIVGDCGLGETLRFATSNAHGNFGLDYVIRRRFTASNGDPIDCAHEQCILSVLNLTTLWTQPFENPQLLLTFRR